MQFEGLDFAPLTEADIPALSPVMKRAFDDDSRRFFEKPEGGPPGYDDGSFLRKWGLNAGAAAYCVREDGKPIGAVILFVRGSRGHLGCLFVDDALIGQGYGSRIWRFAEHAYPRVRLWTTETPAVSYRNHRFYVNRCGFHVVGVEGDMDRFEAQFKLEKRLPNPPEPPAPAPSQTSAVTLRRVCEANLWEIVNLSVKDDQKTFVASNTKSILEAYAAVADGQVALPFGVYEGDTPVGFVMFGYGASGYEGEPAAARDSYCLWRFMIDQRYQGRGLGRAALAAALDFVRSMPCGEAKACWLSYAPENDAARALYADFGFRENGEMCFGEVVAVLELSSRHSEE